MNWEQIIITAMTAIVPAVISYFAARYQGKNDIKKLNVENKAEIDRLVKQHEINLESIKEQHRLEMESKEKDHQMKLQLMQKEYELKMLEKKEGNNDAIVNGIAESFFKDMLNNPTAAAGKMQGLLGLQAMLDQIHTKG